MKRSLENFRARAYRILQWDQYFFQKHFDMTVEEIVRLIDANQTPPPKVDPAKLGYETYGAWSVQEPGFGTIGRFNPDMTVQTGPNTFDLKFRFDRAMYTKLQSLGLDDDNAFHVSTSNPAWSGTHNTQQYGRWRFYLTVESPDIELVAMLWPQDNNEWPDSEVNIVEGHVGAKNPLTNIHWENAYGQHMQAPQHHGFNMMGKHEYEVEILPDRAIFRYDGSAMREVTLDARRNHPYRNPVHFVIQGGCNKVVKENFNLDKPGFETVVKLEFLDIP